MSNTVPHTAGLPQTQDQRRARLTWEARAIEQARAEAEGTIPLEEIEAWVEPRDTPRELPPPEPRK